MPFSEFRPRHVLCLLGPRGAFLELLSSVQDAINTFAPGFAIDTVYSQDAPDARMGPSFVIYVLGPHMETETAVSVSARALRLVAHALHRGATAAKGESAGVAHGAARWRELGRAAQHLTEGEGLAQICRLAFSKRPLSNDDFLGSVGFHLVGLPEVFVPVAMSDDELALTAIIDRVADEMFTLGIEQVLLRHDAMLRPTDKYDEDDFKFNPYGAVHLNASEAAGGHHD